MASIGRRMGPELLRQWVRRVLGHDDLTPTQKTVLVALQTFANYDDGTNAHPGEILLSETCGITTRAVRSAIKRGRDLGLIEQTAEENPRAGRAAVYRIVLIESTTGTTVPVNNSTTGTAVPVNNPTTGTATSPSPEQPFLPPRQSPNFFGLRNSGTSPAPVETTHTPQAPSRYCELHPHGTRTGCWGCKNAGRVFRAWQAEQAAIDVAIARQREQLRENCPDCDGKHWITDDNGEPIKRCDHQAPLHDHGTLALVPPLPEPLDDVRAAR
ncbi:hypothetical protein ACPCIR_12785 [Mycobacterium sp. NPDC051198]